MNIYTKEFFHRGLMFGGFGPIIVGIIFYCVSAAEGGNYFWKMCTKT